MFVARNILSGDDAVWPFQMASGRSANIQRAVYRLSGGALTLLPNNASSVTEPSAGNYLLTVPSAGMAAGNSGDMYFATLSDGDQFVRLQAWTYDNPEHFEKVLADIADLDADLVAVDGKVGQVLTDLAAQTVTLQTEITNAKNHLDTEITNAKNHLDGEITNAEVLLGNAISASQTAVQTDVAAVKADTAQLLTDVAAVDGKAAQIISDVAAVKADTAAILVDTNELQQDWANNGRLDLILDAAASDALGANQKAADIVTSLGNLQGLQLGGSAQGDLAGALTTLYGLVDTVEVDVANAVTNINAHTTSEVSAAETAINAHTTSEVGNLQTAIIADISGAETLITNAISTSEQAIFARVDLRSNNIMTRVGAPADGVSISDDIQNVEAQLQSDISTSEGVITAAISATEAQLQSDISTSEGVITTAITASETAVTGAITAQTTQLQSDISAQTTTLQADIAAVKADVAAVHTDLTTEIAAATSERSAAATERSAQVAERSAAATERTTQATFRTGVNNELAKLGLPAAGSISQDIANIKTLLDGTLTNARLLPFVPSSILSPLQATRLRFTCNVVDGETGAMEAPDNGECGVMVYLTDLSGGGSANVSASALFDASSGGSALPAAPGGANRVPSQFRLMSAVPGRLGAFEGYLDIPAYTHGNYEFEFGIYDSDPSGTPTSFTRSSFMEVRKNVGFTAAGAF